MNDKQATNLEANKSLSHYRILQKIGAGGMGEVYLAEDMRLERKVALKILPAKSAQNADRMQRFVREAKAASALNHPHIAHIYEIGESDDTSFIAMEFVEGTTLREKIHNEKNDLRTLLKYLSQVAEGLAKAHTAGIVHRDLKPDNIMVSHDGFAKILDFGLAKLIEPQVPAGDSGANSEDATAMMPQPLSMPGMIMGTIGYMSPEQARGRKEIDQRSDIFSFGCILYEAATRRQPFGADTGIDSLHKIIHAHPPSIKDFNPEAPADLQRIVRRCLKKDPEERYQTIKDVGIELKELRREMKSKGEIESSISPHTAADSIVLRSENPTIIAGGKTAAATVGPTAHSTSSAGYVVNQIKQHKSSALIAFVALASVIGLVFGLYKFYGSRPSSSVGVPVRVAPLTSSPTTERNPALSPDGKQIAYVWVGEKGDNFDIYVKITDAGTPLRLTTHPEREMSPTWSQDGRFIAFLRGTGENKAFYIVPALGGAERKIADAFGWNQPGVMPQAIDWSPDGKTLAVMDKTSEDEAWSIFLLSVETGEKRKLTTPPAYTNGDVFPVFSPDGQTIAFARTSGLTGNIFRVPVAGGDPVPVTSDDILTLRGLDWTSDGERLVFSSETAGRAILWTIPAEGGGTPAPVPGAGENAWELSASLQGDRLVYAQAFVDSNLWRIEIPNHTGGEQTGAKLPTKLVSSNRLEEFPQFSPDGRRIVFASNRSGSSEIWVCDSEGQNSAQVTNFGASSALTGTPRWSPDGRFIAFDARVSGNADIYIISADGGTPRRLTTDRTEEAVPSWSRDGRFVYFASNRSGRREIWKMPASGGEAVQITREGGDFPFESTDGRVLYYTKGRSLFSSNLWSVSTEGGAETKIFDYRMGRSWAVAERGVYFFAYPPDGALPYTLEFFDFNTRQATRLATFEGPARAAAVFGVTVSPDERWIVYTQRDRLDFDLMLVENFR